MALERHQSFFGAEQVALAALELLGDVALAVGDGLLARIVGGDPRETRARDLDVVAEDLVVSDLEVGDPGSTPLRGLELHHPPLPVGANRAQAIDLGVVPLANEGAAADLHGRLVDDRPADQPAEVRQ